MVVERAVPLLPSRDLARSLDLYGRLGFENRGAPLEEWEYLILGRGDIELHLSLNPDVDPLRTAGACYLRVADADAVHATWGAALTGEDRAAGVRLEPLVDAVYGMREAALVDVDGNLLRFGSALTA